VTSRLCLNARKNCTNLWYKRSRVQKKIVTSACFKKYLQCVLAARILTVDFVVCTLAVKKKKSGQVSICRIGPFPCKFNIAKLLKHNSLSDLKIYEDGTLVQILRFWTLSIILSCLKCRPVSLSKHKVSETGFCLRLQVKPTQLAPIDRASPYLRTPVSLSRWGTCETRRWIMSKNIIFVQ
jgi:hypothetical protein